MNQIMTKNNYQTPQLRVVELRNEGIIAASDRIPVGNNPSTPATKKYESSWSSENWSCGYSWDAEK